MNTGVTKTMSRGRVEIYRWSTSGNHRGRKNNSTCDKTEHRLQKLQEKMQNKNQIMTGTDLLFTIRKTSQKSNANISLVSTKWFTK